MTGAFYGGAKCGQECCCICSANDGIIIIDFYCVVVGGRVNYSGSERAAYGHKRLQRFDGFP